MIRNRKGIALMLSFFVITILLILVSVFIVRSMGERNASEKEKKSIQAFYLAEAGGNEALNKLSNLINTDLRQTVNNINPQTLVNNVKSYVGSGSSLSFLVNYTKSGGTAQFTQASSSAPAIHSGQLTYFGQGTYQYTISVTKNGDPVTVTTDVWDFYYNFKITSTGIVSGLLRKVITQGDFTVRVQHDNFARYALFDVHHTTPSEDNVWFKNTTNFTGPVHTNDQFRFYGNPAGTFDGLVTQHLQKAMFYGNGSPYTQLDADSNGTKDVPIFNVGFQRSVEQINLESSLTQAELQRQAQGGAGGSYSNGIYVNNSGGSLTGGIYVKGDATVEMGKDASDKAIYKIIQGSTTKNITVNYSNNTTTVETVGGSTVVYNGKPDGVDNLGTIIYVDGAVNSLKGTVQKDSQVTVSSQNDIMITNNILYEDYNAGSGQPGESGYVPPNAQGKTNLLGILSWGGNVRIGNSAPNDITMHGSVMARNGIFTDGEDDNDYRSNCYPVGCGTATLLGGAITYFYGPFGTFDPATGEQKSGYGRNFVYDARMAQGNSPPYFPSMKTFIAFTGDIKDKITWQEGG